MEELSPALPVSRPPSGGRELPLAQRFMLSLAAEDSTRFPMSAFHTWFAERCARRFKVSRIPFDALEQWYTEPGTGNLRHRTGRFFSIEGLRAEDGDRLEAGAARPIIVQPEIGTLGLLVREFDGVLHFLMQAKMEPGNINTVQLSPTVQATRSNYTQAHGGSVVRYLEYFARPGRAEVLVDLLQSEHASYFLHKRNRHMVVETLEDVPAHEDFHWLTLGQLRSLLRQEHVVNMDSRTVLSCVPVDSAGFTPVGGAAGPDGGFGAGVLHSLSPAARPRHTLAELTRWLTDMRAGAPGSVRRVPLSDTEAAGWVRTADSIALAEGGPFGVIGAQVEAGNREVPSWSQPLLEPTGVAVHAFLAARLDGVLHVLLQAYEEAGSLNGPELAPTVQCLPGERSRYLDAVLTAPAGRVHYDVLQSEEGGRFHRAESRNMLVEVPEGFPVEQPPEYRWATLDQLARMTRFGHHVNIQARTLLACLPSAW